MKKLTITLKYITLSFVMISGMFISAGQASATWMYTPTYDISYVVTASNIAPSCNAGVDRSITLPTSSTIIPGGGATVTDSDGTVTSTVWSQVGSTPSVATITNGSTLTPTFSNLIQGSYTFRLTGTDNLGATCTDDMVVTVNAAVGNIPPVANAGVDLSITLPSTAVSVNGAASDSDGTISSTLWTKVSGPSTYSIVSPSSLSTSITGMSTAGSYVFRLTATDNLGATGSDDMTVTVSSGSGVTGALTVSPNTCTIALGDSTCTVTGATWSTTGSPTSPNLFDVNTSTILSTLADNAIPMTVWVAYPSTTFNLRDGTIVLDTEVATADCGANTWDAGAGRCVLTPVNGVCAATHFDCSAGSYPGGGTGGSSGPWAWACNGSNGGSNASCFESLPQCSDGDDNDSDGFEDSDDPGCHTDGDAGNPGSYNPNDDNEIDADPAKKQCEDGEDNDLDGKIDNLDPGCHTDGRVNPGDPNITYNPLDDREKNIKIEVHEN